MLAVITPADALPPDLRRAFWPDIIYPLHAVAFSTVGALILSRRPSNRIGWVAVGIGLLTAVNRFAQTYATYATYATGPSLPLVDWMGWLSWWLWVVPFVLVLVYLPLLFPDGQLLSSRWRIVAWLAAAGVLLQLVVAVLERSGLSGDVPVRNPFGLQAPAAVVRAMIDVTGPLPMIFLILATVSLVLRYRRAGSEERQQLKWFTAAVALLALVFVAGVLIAFTVFHTIFYRVTIIGVAVGLAFLSLPVAVGIAVLKHHLYDIDVVINRSLVYGSLAVFATAVYIGIVVGIGAVVGLSGNVGLSLLAAALIAVAFQPVRERLQRVANQLVYGKRANPYQVLAEFSARISETYDSKDALSRMARLLAAGTRSLQATVWLRVGNELRAAAA